VLKLAVNASGNETLTAWYAANGATSLTLGLGATDVGNIWSSTGSLDTFVLQTDASGTTTAYQPFDEMRFGTALADVSAIPEPSTAALLAGGAAGLVLLGRRRRHAASA
jgi:hypothetical protein